MTMLRAKAALTALGAALLLVTSAGAAEPAHAAEFRVDSTTDAIDASPGDGTCATAPLPNGEGVRCTLRAAILETNALAGPDSVLLPAGTYTLTIPLGPGTFNDQDETLDIDVRDELVITGAGADTTIVDANRFPRAFELRSTVTISDLTIRNGAAFSEFGGGLLNRGTATLTRVVVTRNSSLTRRVLCSGGRGGGIYNEGTLTVSHSVVSENSALSASSTAPPIGPPNGPPCGGEGGGIYNQGGHGIYNQGGQLTIVNTSVIGNSARDSGGILSSFGLRDSPNGRTIIRDSTVGQNRSESSAGLGIASNNDVEVTGSSFTENAASVAGGGIAASSGVRLTIENSTFSGNTAGQVAAALILGGRDSTATLVNTTFSGNTAPQAADIYNVSSSEGTPSRLTLRNSIVWACSGPIISGGGNIERGTSCGLTGEGDRQNLDPRLGPLADNGGPTRTYAPLAGSPAVDGAGLRCPSVDQRGARRPVDGDGDGRILCDVGAVEAAAGTTAPPTGCAPGSRVLVRTTRAGEGRIQVVLEAAGNPDNRLASLEFAQGRNALIDVAGQEGRTGAFTVPLPERPRQVTFFVRRGTAGQATTQPLVATDGCGRSPTFVGLGTDG